MKSAARRSISSSLRSCSSAIVPSEISKCCEAQLLGPVDQLVEPVAGDRQLGQRAAEHHRDPVRPVALELGLEVAGRQRGAPAELDDVDRVAGDLDQAVDLGHRQALVEHVGDAVLARLDGAIGEIEQLSHVGLGPLRGVTRRRGPTRRSRRPARCTSRSRGTPRPGCSNPPAGRTTVRASATGPRRARRSCDRACRRPRWPCGSGRRRWRAGCPACSRPRQLRGHAVGEPGGGGAVEHGHGHVGGVDLAGRSCTWRGGRRGAGGLRAASRR